jgi:CheY-like chemotaxis protein
LIVDDSKLARMVMASAFRRLGPEWELIEATNADDAINVIAGPPGSISHSVDFNMPGTDGLGTGGEIRKTHPKMPVAVVSANVQDEIIGRAGNLMPLL